MKVIRYRRTIYVLCVNMGQAILLKSKVFANAPASQRDVKWVEKSNQNQWRPVGTRCEQA